MFIFLVPRWVSEVCDYIYNIWSYIYTTCLKILKIFFSKAFDLNNVTNKFINGNVESKSVARFATGG